MIASSTSPLAASKAAKQIIGFYPHARPPDPDTYMSGLAAILTDYPLGLVQECAHPRTGIARSREFPPTPAALVAWLDKRLAFHLSLSSYKKRAVEPEREFSDDHRATMLAAQVGLSRAMRERPAAELVLMSMQDFAELGRKDKQAPIAEAAE